VLRKLKPLWLLPILFVTSACVSGSTAPLVVSDYCRIAKPIGYDSRVDSAETIRAIEAHNSAWVCVCESDCPASKPS
jgi:hypothetical protein